VLAGLFSAAPAQAFLGFGEGEAREAAYKEETVSCPGNRMLYVQFAQSGKCWSVPDCLASNWQPKFASSHPRLLACSSRSTCLSTRIYTGPSGQH
jgi:hypothetical protein